MTTKDLRQACPEFFDFVVALIHWHSLTGPGSGGPEDAEVRRCARALLAKLEAEKASAETPKCCQHPNIYSGGYCPDCRSCLAIGPCSRCGDDHVWPDSTVGCKTLRPDPKPEPPKRSAEEILEAAIKDHEYNYDLDAPAIKEALRLVRELRAERDELQRRIEAAKACGKETARYSSSVSQHMVRILNGGER